MAPFDLTDGIVDRAVRTRAVAHLRERKVRLPTFAEIANPDTIPAPIGAALAGVGPDDANPLNLFRVHWYNDLTRKGRTRIPVSIELPPALTGVEARIIVAVGALFPLIGAHKVLAAYSCIAPRLVSGGFDPTRQRAVWPSTGNYCRGGVAICSMLGSRGTAVLPAGMSQERFDWLNRWVTTPEDIVRTPGTESNVKEIYDKAAELARDPANAIFNQFAEFGNYLGHWRCTGPALEAAFEAAAAKTPGLRLAAYVSASGSAGTLAAGDYLKDQFGSRTAVVEAVECPTLLYNGYGEHNIQGIGDKHVPLIHNVMNGDFVIGVSDKATDGLLAVFNTPAGRALLKDKGVPDDVAAMLGHFGLSSIANMLGAIKLAKYLKLGRDDAVVTVATDGAGLYASELKSYLAARQGGGLTATAAADLHGTYLRAADTEHVLETGSRERERIFNLGYFTWVEQQGVSLEDFDRRRQQSFWRGIRELVPLWDEMITAFNHDSGVKVGA